MYQKAPRERGLPILHERSDWRYSVLGLATWLAIVEPHDKAQEPGKNNKPHDPVEVDGVRLG